MPSLWSRTQETWEPRIARAQELCGSNPASGQLMNLYYHVLRFQATICDDVSAETTSSLDPSNFRSALDLRRAVSAAPRLATVVTESGPAVLAAELKPWSEASPERLQAALQDWLAADNPPVSTISFIARALLEPQAEFLAPSRNLPPPASVGNRCPACGSAPQLAVIRPEGDGGKRLLLCFLCHTEWEFRRVLCPNCSETDHEKLPRYSTPDFPAVRVEACDTCRTYLKSVDLTVDGHAVPLVDEIAAASLDLWAAERNYHKLVANLVGF